MQATNNMQATSYAPNFQGTNTAGYAPMQPVPSQNPYAAPFPNQMMMLPGAPSSSKDKKKSCGCCCICLIIVAVVVGIFGLLIILGLMGVGSGSQAAAVQVAHGPGDQDKVNIALATVASNVVGIPIPMNGASSHDEQKRFESDSRSLAPAKKKAVMLMWDVNTATKSIVQAHAPGVVSSSVLKPSEKILLHKALTQCVGNSLCGQWKSDSVKHLCQDQHYKDNKIARSYCSLLTPTKSKATNNEMNTPQLTIEEQSFVDKLAESMKKLKTTFSNQEVEKFGEIFTDARLASQSAILRVDGLEDISTSLQSDAALRWGSVLLSALAVVTEHAPRKLEWSKLPANDKRDLEEKKKSCKAPKHGATQTQKLCSTMVKAMSDVLAAGAANSVIATNLHTLLSNLNQKREMEI